MKTARKTTETGTNLWRQRVKRTGEDIFTSFLKLIAQKQTEVTPVKDLPKVFFIYGSVQKIYAII